MRTRHYRPGSSSKPQTAFTFRQQMADFVRGDKLRTARDDRHLSQEDAAHEIGVSTKTLRAWEKGGKIKWKNAQRVGALYKIDPHELVYRDGDETVNVDGRGEMSQLDRIEAMQTELVEKLDRNLEEIREIRAFLSEPDETREETPLQPGGLAQLLEAAPPILQPRKPKRGRRAAGGSANTA